MILALLNTALATDCELHNVKSIDFNLLKLEVDGRDYAFDTFKYELQACGYDDSAEAFERWAKLRLGADATCVVGALCLWPVIVATPVYMVLAYQQRDVVLEAVRRESTTDPD